MTTNPFVPPAAEGLPLAALDSATEGASRLDAAALTPTGRNFLAHALVQLARDGWLRTEPGEGFEPMRGPESAPVPAAVSVPPPTRADDQAALDNVRKLVRRLAAHAEGFGDVLDDSDRDPWAKTVRADIAALTESMNQAAEAPLSPDYEHPECGFHWHGRDGMDIPMRDGQPVCPRCELAKVQKQLDHSRRRREEVGEECKRRGRIKLEQAERIVCLERELDGVRDQLGKEMLRADGAEAELRRMADEAQQQPDTETPTVVGRAALSEKLWQIAEQHIIAEWICCEPLEPRHHLCEKGYAALGMAKTLLVDSDPEKAWNPAAPLLDAVIALLPPPVARAAVLLWAADELGRMDYDTDSNDYGYDTYRDAWNGGVMDGAEHLRRVADEAEAVDDLSGALIEGYLRFLRGQGPEPDLSDLPPSRRQVITGQFEIVKALTDRDLELPPLERDPVARRLGLTGPAAGAQQQPDTETRSRRTVEYFVQGQQPDGTWECASSFSTDPAFAAARLYARRRTMPDLTMRLAERTTAVSVRALPDCLACRHWSCAGDGPCGALLDAWQKCACTGPTVPGPGRVADEGRES